MMGGVVGDDNGVQITKAAFVGEATLQQAADIKIGEPRVSPLGNVGQVKSVSVPHVHAFDPRDLSYPGPGASVQSLAQARILLTQFEQTQ